MGGLVEIQTNKRFHVTSLLSTKNIFYNIIHEDDFQDHDCLNETFICSSSPYEELNSFAPVLLPTNKNLCVLLQTFRWTDVTDSDYFVDNWAVLSGLGNILLFLTKQFQVGQMTFLTHCWSLFNEQEKAEIQDTWASIQDMRANNL